jgi:hypothetical protein
MALGRLSPLAAGAEAETRFVKGAYMAKKKVAKKIIARADLGIGSFADALAHAGEKPLDSATRDQKKNYSERLSNSIAVLLASRLRKAGGFKSILPNPDGLGRETGSASGAQKKLKKTDVRFATQDTGLELLVSVKTLNFHDVKKDKKDPGKIVIGRYTKNMMRNDHELRAEAMDHHERFPYAVLIGLFFIPVDACDDARSGKSSFAHAVITFRPRTGRKEVSDPPAQFERLFIGLYDRDKAADNSVGFFDVDSPPPRQGRVPWHDEAEEARRGGRLLTLDQMVFEIVKEYGIRNRLYIEWADEEPSGTVVLDAPDVLADSEAETDDADSE